MSSVRKRTINGADLLALRAAFFAAKGRLARADAPSLDARWLVIFHGTPAPHAIATDRFGESGTVDGRAVTFANAALLHALRAVGPRF